MAGGCWSWGGLGDLSAEFVPAWGRGLPTSALGWSELAWLLSFSCAPGCGRGAPVSCLLCPVDSGKGP